MSETNDGRLNDKSRELIQLALQDADSSANVFGILKEEFTKKIQGIEPLEKEMSTTEAPSVGYTPELVKRALTMLFKFIAIHYVEMSSIFDFIEIINKNDLETRKNIKALAEALNKNKVQSEDAIRVIIDMLNKHDDKIKDAVRALNEQQVVNKYVKRYFEDKAKDTEKL